jgi:hypothetical protein
MIEAIAVVKGVSFCSFHPTLCFDQSSLCIGLMMYYDQSPSSLSSRADSRSNSLALQVLGFEDIPRPRPRTRSQPRQPKPRPKSLHQQPSQPNLAQTYPRQASRSFSSTPLHRHAELEELRPSLDDQEGEATAVPDPLIGGAGRVGGPSSRRGKAPPPPTRPSSSSSSQTDLLSASRRRASSDPFSDPHARNAPSSRQPPLAHNNSSKRRGPAPPPPPSRNGSGAPLSATSAGGGGGFHLGPTPANSNTLASRSASHASSMDSSRMGDPVTPSGEDFLLLPPTSSASSSGAGGREGSDGSRTASGSRSKRYQTSAGGRGISENVIVDSDDEGEDEDGALPLSPTRTSRWSKPIISSSSGTESDDDDDDDDDSLLPRWRTWILPPHLSNPEVLSLLTLFPSHIRSPPIPSSSSSSSSRNAKTVRFPYLGVLRDGSGRERGLEEGLGSEGERRGKGVVEGREWGGTGRMWVGEGKRVAGWRGSWWERFVGWWKRLF